MTKLTITSMNGIKHLHLELVDGRTFVADTSIGVWFWNGEAVDAEQQRSCDLEVNDLIDHLEDFTA